MFDSFRKNLKLKDLQLLCVARAGGHPAPFLLLPLPGLPSASPPSWASQKPTSQTAPTWLLALWIPAGSGHREAPAEGRVDRGTQMGACTPPAASPLGTVCGRAAVHSSTPLLPLAPPGPGVRGAPAFPSSEGFPSLLASLNAARTFMACPPFIESACISLPSGPSVSHGEEPRYNGFLSFWKKIFIHFFFLIQTFLCLVQKTWKLDMHWRKVGGLSRTVLFSLFYPNSWVISSRPRASIHLYAMDPQICILTHSSPLSSRFVCPKTYLLCPPGVCRSS